MKSLLTGLELRNNLAVIGAQMFFVHLNWNRVPPLRRHNFMFYDALIVVTFDYFIYPQGFESR